MNPLEAEFFRLLQSKTLKFKDLWNLRSISRFVADYKREAIAPKEGGGGVDAELTGMTETGLRAQNWLWPTTQTSLSASLSQSFQRAAAQPGWQPSPAPGQTPGLQNCALTHGCGFKPPRRGHLSGSNQKLVESMLRDVLSLHLKQHKML